MSNFELPLDRFELVERREQGRAIVSYYRTREPESPADRAVRALREAAAKLRSE